jgi:FkbM family methyltransferase
MVEGWDPPCLVRFLLAKRGTPQSLRVGAAGHGPGGEGEVHRGVKALARRVFGALGLEVHRRSALPPEEAGGRSVHGVLSHAASLGLAPATVIDVGAAEGTFTRICRKVFPQASYLLIEPLEEFASALDELQRTVPDIRVHRAAAASQTGEVTLHVHADLYGSSLLLERESGRVNGLPRTVPAVTLDELVGSDGARPPFLLKLDVQGAELEVLGGAPAALAASEFVIMEVQLYRAFEGGSQLADVVAFMKGRGFAAYDISGFLYRPLDGALAAVDVAFVKEDGIFHASGAFATPAQREELNRRFAAAHRAREQSGS